jgi:rfaE bifunctional protein nucleotidyltransferase chain/domain
MSTMLIANNCTVESGSFMGDQLCALKACHMFARESGVDKVIMSMSPGNELHFVWERYIRDFNVEVVWDNWDPGNWEQRWIAWNRWRAERSINGIKFDHYREHYLRIHGLSRQTTICGLERGLGRKNIFEYWAFGQENLPEVCPGSDVYDVEIDHPPLSKERDVYISPMCKTQGNVTFTFEFWTKVVERLLDAGITVTVGYQGHFCEHLVGHHLYKKHWGSYRDWMNEVCRHRIVACGNTGTGWLAAVCGVPLVTMEPPNSQMPDHKYRECGLRNIVEVFDTPDAYAVAKRIIDEVNRVVVFTTGCYDVLHRGHVRHLQRSRTLGTRLVVALNSDSSVKTLKGQDRPINSADDRKAVLEALRCVDEVRICDEPLDVMKELKPDVLTNGFGYTLSTMKGKNEVESWGGRAVITCVGGDESDDLSTTKVVKRIRAADVIELCRIGATNSVNGFDKLKLVADEFLKVADLPGDVADLGAYKGGVSFVLNRLRPGKTLHVFDTWEGTPYDDPLCHHKKGEWKADFEGVVKFVGIATYHKGVFPYTAEGGEFCFVYVDMDTYQATKDAIEFFWPRMVQGGVIVFDDYDWTPCTGVKKAVDEVFDKKRVITNLFTCIVEKR